MDARDLAVVLLLVGFAAFVSHLRTRRLRALRAMQRPVDRSTHEPEDAELAEFIRWKEAERDGTEESSR